MLLTKDLKNVTDDTDLYYKVFQLYHWPTKIIHYVMVHVIRICFILKKIFLYTNVPVPCINCISVLFNHTMISICVQTFTSLLENFVISSAYIFYSQASLHILKLTVLTI